MRRIARSLCGLVALLSLSTMGFASGDSGAGLKTIDNPGGGQVVYGPLSNVTSLKDAMAAMLRLVHGHFGDRPQIGKFFQSKGSDSVATFFTVTANKQGGKHVAGLVIVSVPAGSSGAGEKGASAAVLYDDADRFGKTEPVLMKKLNAAWQTENVRPAQSSNRASASATPGREYAVLPLERAVVSDNSASVDLPSGWKITGGGGGTIHAAGPKGEVLHLGVIVGNIYDPNNPRSRQMLQYMSRGSTAYYVCANGDLVTAWQCLLKQNSGRQHTTAPTITVKNVQRLPRTQYETQVVMVGAETDFHDEKGLMTSSVRIGSFQEGADGGWAMTITGEHIPQQLAEQEWPTLRAIVASYRQNGQVIQGQTDQVIANIHARSEANTRISEERSAQNDRNNAAVESRWDDQAKANKTFENYQMDRAVVRDTEVPAHGTFDYPTADWLVKSDPNRFQYVPTQDLLKGLDY